MVPERRFIFRWHDYDPGSGKAIEDQATTTVEFHLAPAGTGTRLTIIEHGFEVLPESRRIQVMRDNSQAWDMQAQNIADHVERQPQ